MTTLKLTLDKDLDECVGLITQLKTKEDVAKLVEVPIGQLLHILYNLPKERHCKIFTIPKKTKGVRTITAPIGSKLILQNKLKPIIDEMYRIKVCVHGFAKNRSIVTNAHVHRKKRYVLNIDLKDFFPTIHFGRIRGLFMRFPFNMCGSAASIMAQMCTQGGELAQGSPLSPVLSNFIAADLDRKMIVIAKRYKLTYTRYADDLTFSSSHKNFPKSVANWDGDNPITSNVVLGDLLVTAVSAAGFEINYSKVRMQIRSVRQEVTGLTVNEFPNVPRSYIRNIRAMIHAWEKYGLMAAEATLIAKFAKSPPDIDEGNRNGTYFKSVLYGKIAFVKMVRGEEDEIYMKLCLKAASIDTSPPQFIQKIKNMHEKFDVFISHASEDKDLVVRLIFEELEKLGVLTFLDEVHIGWGDSLTEKINHALGQSKYVLAVISASSIAKAWPLKELNSALSREMAGKQKILPLIVGDVDLSPLSLLEDKKYLEWESNPGEIAKNIHALVLHHSFDGK